MKYQGPHPPTPPVGPAQPVIATAEQIKAPASDQPATRRPMDTATTRPDSMALVHVNASTAAQLLRLPGIGVKGAQGILAYRERHGPLRSPADLEAAGLTPKSARRAAVWLAFD